MRDIKPHVALAEVPSIKMVGELHVWTTVLASFMASLVECVEAMTVVLAVGTVRGWKSALSGTGSALLTLFVLVLLLGQSLALIPLPAVQVSIGLLLLLFGLRWLRKAILRASGVIALHDEDAAFAEETAVQRSTALADGRGWDQVAFVTAYKIVMLEGIEVVFIVIALGSSTGVLVPAALGAAAALSSVVLLGLALHRPLSRVPENTLKFAVGVLISTLGTFWVGEGIGITWPAGERSLLALAGLYLLIGQGLVVFCRQRGKTWVAAAPSPTRLRRRPIPRALTRLLSLFIDDGWLAAGTLTWVALCTLSLHFFRLTAASEAVGFAAGPAALLCVSASRGVHFRAPYGP